MGIIGSFLGVAVLLLAQAQIDAKKVETDAQDSVVKIVLLNTVRQMNNVGTGFFVAPNLIATASHVFLDGEKNIVDGGGGQLMVGKVFRSGKRFYVPFEVAASDFPHDIILLRVDPQAIKQQVPEFDIKPLALDSEKPDIADAVFFLGYFGGDDFPLLSRTVVAGFTSVVPGVPPTPEQIVLDLPANPGQSGSPVISLESGKVVGVLASFVPVTLFPGVPPTHSGLSRSVEVEHLKLLMASAEVR